jgi:hypothetical protein
VTESSEAMAEMAERITGMMDELTDMALDALRRATSGDPDSLEAGQALALERRVVRARRALERAAVVLSDGAAAGRDPLDDGA